MIEIEPNRVLYNIAAFVYNNPCSAIAIGCGQAIWNVCRGQVFSIVFDYSIFIPLNMVI